MELTPMYPELLRLAKARIRRDPLGHFWSPESLISEAWIRLAQAYGPDRANGAPTMALWNLVMGNVLVDHARAMRSQKRGADRLAPYDENLFAPAGENLDARIRVRQAWRDLAANHPRSALAIRLTVIEGFTMDQAAPRLRVASRTVKRAVKTGIEELRASLQA